MPLNVQAIDLNLDLEAGKVEADGDLTVQVRAFKYDVGGTHGAYVGAVAQSVADDDESYVCLLESGNLEINITGWPGTAHIRLARVVTSGGQIIAIHDERPILTTGGGTGLPTKVGVVGAGSFSGAPLKASVTFGAPFATSNYAVTLDPVTSQASGRGYAPTPENKQTTGFDINLHSARVNDLVEVGWQAIENGET